MVPFHNIPQSIKYHYNTLYNKRKLGQCLCRDIVFLTYLVTVILK